MSGPVARCVELRAQQVALQLHDILWQVSAGVGLPYCDLSTCMTNLFATMCVAHKAHKVMTLVSSTKAVLGTIGL